MTQTAFIPAAGISNENDEWYTPAWMFQALRVTFDLDPCSPGVPPSSVPALRHLTKADNGLAAEWSGRVWLNPPFSSKRDWYARLVEHGNGIALMPARTETHDFQDYMNAAQALLFVKGRIYFERGSKPGANGNGVTSTPPLRHRPVCVRRGDGRCIAIKRHSRCPRASHHRRAPCLT